MGVRLPDLSYSHHRDPLLPWLSSISNALSALTSSDHVAADFRLLLSQCLSLFKSDHRYRDDARFLKIWFLYMDSCDDFHKVFMEMEENRICLHNCLLYETYALFLEAKGNLHQAASIYRLGISRNAQPIESLTNAYRLFLSRMKEILIAGSRVEETPMLPKVCNPWTTSVVNIQLRKINQLIVKYEGYHATNRPYAGKVSLSSLHNSSRNKIIEIGGRKYQIKGCAGQGGFAKVFRAYLNSNPDEVVALKIQKPPFPWEFHMYRLLDHRISGEERSSYGFAHKVHIYSDYSILICDYLPNGTLQDAINSYVVVGQSMEEVLCIYYTSEMLYMLERLHTVGIIHGDFKPDNLLIRYAKSVFVHVYSLENTYFSCLEHLFKLTAF
uniref:Mitotic checkpoint serine/threonine-protein kinase BUB1 n=1 Tax=Kalanchoe fedtschenkoi TaxID=63787 RepID=A0A7N0UM90_KALFE